MVYVQVFDFDYLSETELEKTRAILIEFLNDPTPDIKYYINHSWGTLYDSTTIENLIERVQINKISFFELFTDIVNKLYTFRDNVWSTKKIELTNMVIGIIKRVDEELAKCGGIEIVEKMFERLSYESLSTLPYYELISKLNARFEGLFQYVHLDETGTVVTNLIKFLKNIDEQIVKYNRIE
uniref:Phage protein n=1 Tax=Panagrellus redivivus TaxID=6233 RepID=A0A7E4ULA7_PANRE